jgi:DNA repair protein RadD
MLRKYQEDCLENVVRCLKEKQEGIWLVSIPTGGGKSFIIAEFLKRQVCKCLIIQPSIEILQQNYEKYTSYGFRASIYSGKQKELSEDCIFCTLQSVYNKPQLFQGIECVIIDEVHSMDLERKKSMFSKFLSKISAKKILGFTATAYRNYYKTKWEYGGLYQETSFGMLTDQKAVNGFAYVISYKELMDQGYLKKIVYYQWDKTFDNSRLKLNSQGTNYDEKAVEEYTAREDRVATIMQAILFTMTKRNKIIIYASCKKQANMLLEELKHHQVLEVAKHVLVIYATN